MEKLLSRYAMSALWMGRYIERAENSARLIHVNDTFARDDRGTQNWRPMVDLNADGERFDARHAETTAQTVLHFYLLDNDNPTSIRAAVRMARENARTLRPLISTELWSQLNVFHNQLAGLTPADIAMPRLTHLCTRIKEACQAHTGIVEGTVYRDQGWYFYFIGRYLERADQTTRLIDVKSHLLLPRAAEIGSPLDIRQWNAVLRSAAGYHAFRRVHSRGLRPADVVAFLLVDPAFPRSVIGSLRQVNTLLTELKSRYRLRGGNAAMEKIDEMLAALGSWPATELVRSELHEFLDWLQQDIGAVYLDLAGDFFDQVGG